MTKPKLITPMDITLSGDPDVSLVWDSRCVLGEGPCWDRASDRILFLDIKGGTLNIFNVATGIKQIWVTPDTLSSLGQTPDGSWVGTTRRGLVSLDFQKTHERRVIVSDITSYEPSAPDNRFNDGKIDAYGRYWAGTMDDRETGEALGQLICFSKEAEPQIVLNNMIVPNGPTFDTKRRIAYFADSARSILYKTAIDPDGTINTPVAFLKFDQSLGYPDGMTCDDQGNIWVAFWDGACIRRISPDGHLITEFTMPFSRPTSLVIVPGALYVTSARIGLSSGENTTSQAGGLFKLAVKDLRPGPDLRFGNITTCNEQIS